MNLPKITNCLIEPYWRFRPYYEKDDGWIGDFPIQGGKDLHKGWAEVLKQIQKPEISESLKNLKETKTNFIYNPDGSVSFKLEVVGYGKEHVSAEIKNSALHISGKNGQKSFNQQYQIPSPEKLDLAAISAKVEHGLLEIVFPAKKTEVKTVKIL